MKECDHLGIVIVDVCSANAITSINIEGLIEEKFPEVAVLKNDCLSYCGLCAASPYAMVNGKLIHGKTVDACLDNIIEAIKKELAIFA